MPPRPRRTFRSGRSSRRRVIWAEFDAIINMTANNQWITLDMLQTYKAATGATAAKITIMRTHFSLTPVGALAAGDRFWTGARVYDLNDITGATTTSAMVSNPHDNPYDNWAWMSRHSVDAIGGVHPGGSPGMPTMSGVDVDLRSRRRLDNLQETWGFVLYQDTVGTVAKTYHLFARTLLALP
jgi:hypothetical protein